MTRTIIHPDDRNKALEIATKHNVTHDHILRIIDAIIFHGCDYVYRCSYQGKTLRSALATYENEVMNNCYEDNFELVRDILDLRVDCEI